MNSPYKVSLTKLYNKLHLESYDITLVQFIKFAEKQGYKPWKELSLYDKGKGYNLDNMYFSYNTQPSLAQCGFKLDGTPRKVMRDSERVNQLKMIGAVNRKIDTVVDDLRAVLHKRHWIDFTEYWQSTAGVLQSVTIFLTKRR